MENVMKKLQVASMKALHEMYKLGDGNRKYCFKMKERIEKKFAKDIFFNIISSKQHLYFNKSSGT